MTEQQFAALFGVLCQIRDALVPPPEEATDGCQHPDDRRVDLSTIGDPNHVMCGACKTRIS